MHVNGINLNLKKNVEKNAIEMNCPHEQKKKKMNDQFLLTQLIVYQEYLNDDVSLHANDNINQ